MMNESGLQIRGLGYVPGVAHGVLRVGAADGDGIALVSQQTAVGMTSRPAGVVVVDGAPLSHDMIGLVARAIPMVVIDRVQAQRLEPGAEVWIDGVTGVISSDGSGMPLRTAGPPAPRAGHAVRLGCGTKVWLMASVRSTNAVLQAVAAGAASIGLVRTEFLGLEREQPPDRGYFEAGLHALCSAAGPLAITFRLVDLAADKPPRWLHDGRSLLGPLGMQGARLFSQEPVQGVVRAELEALAALSERFPIEVLIPYLGSRDELERWTAFVRGYMPQGVLVGSMVETPAAVLDITNWGEVADFLAVGCNDLMQCLFGIDRDEPLSHSCLDPYSPVLFRLLAQAADSAGGYLNRVRLCGVLPRIWGVLPVLVGLGYRRFSADAVWIPYLAEGLRELTLGGAQELAREVCACRQSSEVRQLLQGTLPAGVQGRRQVESESAMTASD